MKHQIPISKPQSNSKRQAPTSKLQRSSKIQSYKTKHAHTFFRYSETIDPTVVVNENPSGNGDARHPFDLEERTARFGEEIVRFCNRIPRNPTNDRLIGQLAGCGTSIGGNYCEANEGVSKKDFRNVIGRCVKEAKETKFFLRMIATAEPKLADHARALFREAKELHLIFASIFRK
jgi:four helix bundle protein